MPRGERGFPEQVEVVRWERHAEARGPDQVGDITSRQMIGNVLISVGGDTLDFESDSVFYDKVVYLMDDFFGLNVFGSAFYPRNDHLVVAAGSCESWRRGAQSPRASRTAVASAA